MIRVAIIRENGLFYGGTEKFLQIMAAETNKDEFQIDYYTTDKMRSPDREKYLLDNNVNIIKFKVNEGYKSFPFKYLNKYRNNWSDFWNKFNKVNNKTPYDVIQITNFGWKEEPFQSFKDDYKVCEFTVFPPYVKFPGVKHHILNSEWLRDQWLFRFAEGHSGRRSKTTVIPVPVKKTSDKNLRKELGISEDTIVFGFHQRNDNGLFSPVQLDAFSKLEKECDDVMMLVLNGCDLYKKQAENLNIKNIKFIPYQDEVSPFLNTLDVYAHGRKDGETYGMVLAEAMLHGLPCISHTTPYYNAMNSVIGSGGFVVNSGHEYFQVMEDMLIDSYRNATSKNALRIANENYTYDIVIPKIEEVWRKVANE